MEIWIYLGDEKETVFSRYRVGVRLHGKIFRKFNYMFYIYVFILFFYRMHVARKEYLQNKKGIILLQCCVRRMAARKELKRLKVTYNVCFFFWSIQQSYYLSTLTLFIWLIFSTKDKRIKLWNHKITLFLQSFLSTFKNKSVIFIRIWHLNSIILKFSWRGYILRFYKILHGPRLGKRI